MVDVLDDVLDDMATLYKAISAEDDHGLAFRQTTLRLCSSRHR